MNKSRIGFVSVVTVFLFLVWFTGAFANGQNITTVVGNGTAGYNGNQTASTLQLSSPAGVAVDDAGDLFIADTGNCTVWEMPSGLSSSANLTRFAGAPGFCTTSNPTGPILASELTLYNPAAVAVCTVNGTANLYIATHLQSVTSPTFPYPVTYTPASLFKVNITTGTVALLQMPGNNLSTTNGGPVYPDPQGLACDTNGNVYMESLLGYGLVGPLSSLDEIPASGSPENLIQQFDTFFMGAAVVDDNNVDDIYTVSSYGDVLEYNASSSYVNVSSSRTFVNASSIASDSKGTLYISEDTDSNAPSTLSNYVSTLAPPSQAVTVIAGNGTAGFSGDGGLPTAAQLKNPGGVAIDSAGDVFIADTGNNRIREIAVPPPLVCPAPPTLTPDGGNYYGNATVTITENPGCPDPTTFYFLTGPYTVENATTASTLYTGPLYLTGPPVGEGTSTEYVGAIAVQNGTASAVTTVAYTFSGDPVGLLESATTASQAYGAVYQDGSEAYPFLVPPTAVGGSSGVTLLLTNVGGAAITGSSALSATGSGPFGVSTGPTISSLGEASCNFVAGLPAGSLTGSPYPTICTETVTFTPTSGGTSTGYITLTGNASNEPIRIFFSGTAIATGGPGEPSHAIPEPPGTPDTVTPISVAITADQQAVALNSDGTLLVIDGSTDALDSDCAAPSLVGSGGGILADPALNQIYAVFGDSGSSPYELGIEKIAANGASCTPASGQAPGQFSSPPAQLAYDTYNGNEYVYTILPSADAGFDEFAVVNLNSGAMTTANLGYDASYPWIAVDPASHLVFIGSDGGLGTDTLYEVNPFATGGPIAAGYGSAQDGPYSSNGFVVPNPANTSYGELVLVGGVNPNSEYGNTTAPFFGVQSFDISKFTVSGNTLSVPSPLVNITGALQPTGASDIDRVDGIVYAAVTDISNSQADIAAFYFRGTSSGNSTIVATGASAFQAAFDAAYDYLFWTDGSTISELQFQSNQTAPVTLFTGTAFDLTVDQINGKLYAIDGTNILIFDPPAAAVLTSPTPGLSTVLGTSNVLFQWSAGLAVTDYQLNLSAIAPGDSELGTYKGTALSATVQSLPANGVTVYARLYSYRNGAWQYNDYVYTESGTAVPATLQSPTPGLSTVLGSSNVGFEWNAGTGVTLYQFCLSAIGPGGCDLHTYKGTALSATVPTVPANGVTVYATLWSHMNGAWQPANNYLYTESGTTVPATLQSPTPGLGTVLGTSNVGFQWNAGTGVTLYQFCLSAIGPGACDLHTYKGTALSATVPSLPANGVTVYATLWSYINGVWQPPNNYLYTEQ
ncbi:MAG: hypothetical protein ABSE46_19575 [Terracidiphilus sp.]|jgi:hypothetical protein